jgi:radical SAM protein with 4Fe4S-binding SPASM domain
MRLWGDFVDQIKIQFMLEATTYEKDKFVSKRNKKLNDEYYDFEKQTNNFVCGYPFNILTIAFDGKIALCCNDFSASMNIGNIRDGIDRVFNSQVLEDIRKEFYEQKLDKCKECSFFHKPKPSDIDKIKKSILLLDNKFQNKIKLVF